MPFKYSTKMTEKSACAVGVSLPISTKHSVEVCAALRHKTVEQAKKILEQVIAGKRAIHFGRRFHSVGHKKNVGAGRFPKKACMEILKIIKSAETNAQYKGLNTAELVISCINAHKSKRMRYGRRRREGKSTHIEVIVEEKSKEAEK